MGFKDKLFEDAVNISGGIFTSAQNLGQIVKAKLEEKLDKCAGKLNFVSREEFDNLLDITSHLRVQQELLMKKIDELSNKTDSDI